MYCSMLFSEHEAAAIVLGLLGSPWLEVDLSAEAVEGALSKITRVLPDAVRERVLAMSSAMILSSYRDETRPDASLLMLLSQSVQALRCVDLTYRSDRDEITHRTVEPYGLVGRRGRWYLVGFCRLREDFDLRAYALRSLEGYPVNFHRKVLFKAPPARGVPFIVQDPPELREAFRRLAEEAAGIAAAR